MTETFGTRLRRARESRHITLAQIAERTKIKASLFDALERDDPSQWPCGIFRRSFMRAYAQAVGLDPDETLREFLQRFPDPADPPQASPSGAPSQGAARPGTIAAPASALSVGAAAPNAGAPLSLGLPLATAGTGASGLRLTLVETGFPFTGGRVLADARRRWSAAAWDLGSLLAIAVSVFVVMDSFWMPFSVTALCYYVGGVLLLGNSPGVCLFAPRPAATSDGNGPHARRIRRADPAPVRHEPVFRARRWQNEARN